MRTKATGLFTKSRRAIDEGDFRVKKAQNFEFEMLENFLKPKETPTVHARKHFS